MATPFFGSARLGGLLIATFVPLHAAAVLHGRVTSAGAALPGVTVIALHHGIPVEESTLTGSDGKYRLELQYFDEVAVLARRLGYRESARQTLRPVDKTDTAMDFTLDQETNDHSVIEQLPYSSFVDLLPDGWMR